MLSRKRVQNPLPRGEAQGEGEAKPRSDLKFPRQFWLILIGVLIFGLGDFSRTFLIYLAANVFGGSEPSNAAGTLVRLSSVPMLLYAMHNAVSALAAYPAGHLGDRRAKLPVLVAGYALGVATNVLLIFGSNSMIGLVAVFMLSGTYIAVEETLEKAVVADLLPRTSQSGPRHPRVRQRRGRYGIERLCRRAVASGPSTNCIRSRGNFRSDRRRVDVVVAHAPATGGHHGFKIASIACNSSLLNSNWLSDATASSI